MASSEEKQVKLEEQCKDRKCDEPGLGESNMNCHDLAPEKEMFSDGYKLCLSRKPDDRLGCSCFLLVFLVITLPRSR